MKNLHELRGASLTHTEAGQFIKRNLSDLATANIDLETDIHIKNYITQMQADSNQFDKALQQIQKKEETDVLAELDRERDASFTILNRQLKVFELSKNPAETAAFKSLKIVFAKYKNLIIMNYEAETNAINNLLQNLSEQEYAVHVETLNLSNYVSRLRSDNNEFDAHFTNRSTETASTTVYNAKAIRKTMIQNYSNYANYVQLISDSTNAPYYNGILDIINNNRKQYSDLLSRRQGNKMAAKTKPTVS
jgi:hypothetical protein